jgi:hypothetical protein
MGRLRLHIRVHLRWVGVSAGQSVVLVVTGAWCPPTEPVVNAVELQATTEPHSRGVQPGVIYVGVVQREPAPGGPGSGLYPGRGRFLFQLPLCAAHVEGLTAGLARAMTPHPRDHPFGGASQHGVLLR